MDQKIKTEWLEALRSGKYEQGQDYLNRFNKFCCLGVLCDLYLKEKSLSWDEVENSDEPAACKDAMTYPPDEVFKWAGGEIFLEDSGIPGLFDRNGRRVMLTELNDDDRLDFGQLADVINYFY